MSYFFYLCARLSNTDRLGHKGLVTHALPLPVHVAPDLVASLIVFKAVRVSSADWGFVFDFTTVVNRLAGKCAHHVWGILE